jgi:elongation of very long chain fatty acids protein 4
VAGGNSAFAATINSGIHVIMYTYYFLASMGIDRRWLWWKRWLTQMQIAQFFAVFAHAAYANWEVWTGRCKFPLWMGFANLVYMVSMITLFGAFYINSYARNGKTGKNGASKKTE